MKTKLTRLAVGLVIMAAIFTQNPINTRAVDVVSDEAVVVVEKTTTADSNTEATVETEDASEEVEITINDEETPLYAGDSTEISYGLYCWIVCFGVALILGGVLLFQKKHN